MDYLPSHPLAFVYLPFKNWNERKCDKGARLPSNSGLTPSAIHQQTSPGLEFGFSEEMRSYLSISGGNL